MVLTTLRHIRMMGGLLLLTAFFIPSANAAEAPEVAYIEETLVMADGTEQVYRYRPGEQVQRIQVEQEWLDRDPVQRGLTTIEKLELDRLETDYELGRIGPAEYHQRKNQILKSTYIKPKNDELLNQSYRY